MAYDPPMQGVFIPYFRIIDFNINSADFVCKLSDLNVKGVIEISNNTQGKSKYEMTKKINESSKVFNIYDGPYWVSEDYNEVVYRYGAENRHTSYYTGSPASSMLYNNEEIWIEYGSYILGAAVKNNWILVNSTDGGNHYLSARDPEENWHLLWQRPVDSLGHEQTGHCPFNNTVTECAHAIIHFNYESSTDTYIYTATVVTITLTFNEDAHKVANWSNVWSVETEDEILEQDPIQLYCEQSTFRTHNNVEPNYMHFDMSSAGGGILTVTEGCAGIYYQDHFDCQLYAGQVVSNPFPIHEAVEACLKEIAISSPGFHAECPRTDSCTWCPSGNWTIVKCEEESGLYGLVEYNDWINGWENGYWGDDKLSSLGFWSNNTGTQWHDFKVWTVSAGLLNDTIPRSIRNGYTWEGYCTPQTGNDIASYRCSFTAEIYYWAAYVYDFYAQETANMNVTVKGNMLLGLEYDKEGVLLKISKKATGGTTFYTDADWHRYFFKNVYNEDLEEPFTLVTYQRNITGTFNLEIENGGGGKLFGDYQSPNYYLEKIKEPNVNELYWLWRNCTGTDTYTAGAEDYCIYYHRDTDVGLYETFQWQNTGRCSNGYDNEYTGGFFTFQWIKFKLCIKKGDTILHVFSEIPESYPIDITDLNNNGNSFQTPWAWSVDTTNSFIEVIEGVSTHIDWAPFYSFSTTSETCHYDLGVDCDNIFIGSNKDGHTLVVIKNMRPFAERKWWWPMPYDLAQLELSVAFIIDAVTNEVTYLDDLLATPNEFYAPAMLLPKYGQFSTIPIVTT